MLEKLKQRWKIESNIQIITIFIVFAITGFSVLFTKDIIYTQIGVSPEWAWYTRLFIWISTILPTYYMLLLFYGTVFGQKKFFVWFTKQSFVRFRKKKKRSD